MMTLKTVAFIRHTHYSLHFILPFPQNEYVELVQCCMNFACELMDLCRGTQEVEAVLGEENAESRDPLARLRLAINYDEKKVYIIFSAYIFL